MFIVLRWREKGGGAFLGRGWKSHFLAFVFAPLDHSSVSAAAFFWSSTACFAAAASAFLALPAAFFELSTAAFLPAMIGLGRRCVCKRVVGSTKWGRSDNGSRKNGLREVKRSNGWHMQDRQSTRLAAIVQ